MGVEADGTVTDTAVVHFMFGDETNNQAADNVEFSIYGVSGVWTAWNSDAYCGSGSVEGCGRFLWGSTRMKSITRYTI
jgi:hypothetical protein